LSHAHQAQYSLRQVVCDDRRPPAGLEQHHHVFPRLNEGVTIQSDEDKGPHAEVRNDIILTPEVIQNPKI